MLRLEIVVHWDGQLQVSHLILRLEPMYSTWQAFGQALLVDNPHLSYIGVQHVNFLPPKLIVGERAISVHVIPVRTNLHPSGTNLLNVCLVIAEN